MSAVEDLEKHILEKYDIVQMLGKGAYGVVFRAIDRSSRQEVAIKKVFDAFHNSTDAQRTYREVIFLNQLKGHDSVVKLLGVIEAKNPNDLYLIFEFMETDLHAVIRGEILEDIHKQFIVYQILKGLKYIHSADIIHRDLKPSNILLNSDCLVKIADFGLARSIAAPDDEGSPVLTEYIATRWYRAPEIVLGSQKYSKAVDIWSVGCILAEMIVGRAIFPGKSTLNQIELILELLGKPSLEEVAALDSPLAANLLSGISVQKKRSFTSMFSKAGKDALDLLRKMLSFSPLKRITVEEALTHPYLKSFHSPSEETLCPHKALTPLDDNIKLSKGEYKRALCKFIQAGAQPKNSPADRRSRSRTSNQGEGYSNLHSSYLQRQSTLDHRKSVEAEERKKQSTSSTYKEPTREKSVQKDLSRQNTVVEKRVEDELLSKTAKSPLMYTVNYSNTYKHTSTIDDRPQSKYSDSTYLRDRQTNKPEVSDHKARKPSAGKTPTYEQSALHRNPSAYYGNKKEDWPESDNLSRLSQKTKDPYPQHFGHNNENLFNQRPAYYTQASRSKSNTRSQTLKN